MEGALSTCPVREGDLFRMRSPNTTAVSYGVVKEIRGQFNEEGATVEWELSAWGAKKNGKINGATRSRINKLYEVELVAKKGSFNSVVNV